MNKKLIESMRAQMTPGAEVRAALDAKLSEPVSQQSVRWRRGSAGLLTNWSGTAVSFSCGAVAVCAALLLCAYFWPGSDQVSLHSYTVMESGIAGYITENTAAIPESGLDTGAGGGAFIGALPPKGGDVPVQEQAAEAYQKLMEHFGDDYPAWYGGAYISEGDLLTVLLVESEDPGDKTLELQVLEWTDDGRVGFSTAKYSLTHLKGLMEQLNELSEQNAACREYMAGWGIDEESNRIELSLTEANEKVLSILSELDPEDDAIYVKVGQRANADLSEDPVSHTVQPGGAVVPEGKEPILEGKEPIAIEPWVDDADGAHYDILPAEVEDLPEKKPGKVQSVPEGDMSASECFEIATSSCVPDASVPNQRDSFLEGGEDGI